MKVLTSSSMKSFWPMMIGPDWLYMVLLIVLSTTWKAK